MPVEQQLDEETQKFIAQSLTDVDLFASYGLTQKAIGLLEAILRRAPMHTPTLEKLLDFVLGAGDDRRTAELAAHLEHIHAQRGDTRSSERFGELRRRFQRAAGLTDDEIAAAVAAAMPQPVEAVPFEEAAAVEEIAATEESIAEIPAEAAADETVEIPVEVVEAAQWQRKAFPLPKQFWNCRKSKLSRKRPSLKHNRRRRLRKKSIFRPNGLHCWKRPSLNPSTRNHPAPVAAEVPLLHLSRSSKKLSCPIS